MKDHLLDLVLQVSSQRTRAFRRLCLLLIALLFLELTVLGIIAFR